MKKTVCQFLSSFRSVTLPPAASALLLLLGGFVLFGWLTRGRANLNLDIAPSGTNALVYWTNAGVTLQSSLNSTGTWNDLTGAVSPYLTPTTNKTAFFRLRQTSSSPALITDIEPAFLTTNGGTFYLVGTNFGSGSQVYLNGNLASVTFLSSNLLSVSISTLGAGTYSVSVVNGGQTNAVLADGLTVENTPHASLEVPPGMSPAVTASGEVKQSFVDLVIPSGVGPSFTLARSYRSRIGPTNSPVGNGWDFSSDIFVQTNGANVVVNDGWGRSDTFFLQSDGTYSRAGFFRQGTLSNQVFTLVAGDKSRYEFNALNATVAPGKIAQNIDRNGNAMTYAYNSIGQLTNVTDALGRPTQFSYNGTGQLTSVQDYAGRTTTYTYDGNNNLSSATTPAVTGTPNGNDFPEGKTTTYTYDSNHHLTSVIDPTGTVVQTNQYSPDPNPADLTYDHVTSIALGTNPPTVYSYQAQTPTPGNRYVTTEMYVNDPVGNVTVVYYDSQNRPLQIYEYTGRATPGVPVTATSNQPTGQLRPTDPAYYQTTCSYDLNSLPTQITEPRGNTLAMVYEYDANNAAPVRERGNLLTMTQTPAPGAPADQIQRVDQWQYLPGFGTDEGAIVSAGKMIPGRPSPIFREVDATGRPSSMVHGGKLSLFREVDAKGRPSSLFREVDATGRPSACLTEFDYRPRIPNTEIVLEGCISSFPTNHTDPRGNVTTASYDANGNLLTVQPPGIATGYSYGYNTAGQLTAQTHPADANGRRQQDTFSYYASGGAQNGYLQNAVVDAGGLALTTSYSYDAFGNVTNIVDPRGNNIVMAYNQLDQVMQISSPTGPAGLRSQTTFTYDAAGTGGGRVINKSVLNFDQNGNVEASSPLTTSYSYDTISRLTSVTNEVSASASTVMRYIYDANGQVTSVMSPLAVSGADALNTMQFSYDERGLPFQQISAPGSAGQSTTQYNYDANANLASVNEGLEGTPRTTTVVADGFTISGDACLTIADLISGPCLTVPTGGPAPTPGGDDIMMGSWLKHPGSFSPSPAAVADLNGDGIPDLSIMMSACLKHPTQFTPAHQAVADLNGDGIPDLAVAMGAVLRHPTIFSPASVAIGDLNGDGIPDLVAAMGAWLKHPGKFTPAAVAIGDLNGDGIPDLEIAGAEEVTAATDPDIGLCSPASITDPMGNVTTYHYDANDNLVSCTVNGTNGIPGGQGNVLLSLVTAQYDALDRLTNAAVSILNASGTTTGSATTSLALTDNGQTIAHTDANGHTTSFAYDTVSRLNGETDPKGNSTSYTYDPNSNVIAVTNRQKSDLGTPDLVFVRTFSYDELDRVTNSTDNVGNTTSCAYDSRDNVVQTTDARGIVSQYQYDGLSRLTAAGVDMNNNGNAFDTGDIITSYAYDGNSRLTSQTDPNGNVTSYAYDSLNRCTATTNADATVSSVTYDPHDNVITSMDANGTEVAYSYDPLDCIVAASITPGTGVATTTTSEQYSYDGLNRVIYAANNNATNSFTYDSLSRKLTETQNGLTETNTYDAVGNCLTIAYPGGRQLGYAYGTANLCRAVTLLADPTGDTLGLISTNAYVGSLFQSCSNRNGTYSQITYDGGGAANTKGDDGWGQIRSIRQFGTNGTVIDAISLTYDAAQNKTGRTTGFLGLTNALTCVYDNADRLTNAVVSTNSVLVRNTVYSFDKAGNRTNVTGEACLGAYTMNSTIPPGDFEMNRYTTTPCDSRTYNDDGDLVSVSSTAGPSTNQYDYANRLVQVQTVNYGTGVPVLTTVASYAYDALGRRVSKTVFSGGLPPTTTQFLYNCGNVVEERNGNTTTATYVYCDGHNDGNETDVDGVQNGNETDVAVVKDGSETDVAGGVCFMMSRAGQDYYLHTDDQGNTLALTATGSTVIERYDYDDYGAITFLTSAGYPNTATSSTVGNPNYWGGLRLDAETGLQNDNGGVYFEPQTGRELMGKRRHPCLLPGSLSDDMTGNNPWSGAGAFGVVYKGRWRDFSAASDR